MTRELPTVSSSEIIHGKQCNCVFKKDMRYLVVEIGSRCMRRRTEKE